ncbi:MAG: hypothetical protein OCD01_18300 [Fibrobacterales bacterium]
MRSLVLILAIILIATPVFSKTVASKDGDLMLTRNPGGGGDVCTALANESMVLLKKNDNYVLVKADCGQGWVDKKAIVFEKLTGDKSMNFDQVDIMGWLDNPSAIFVLDDKSEETEGVDLNRNFKEYMKHTMDREQVEMKNQDN